MRLSRPLTALAVSAVALLALLDYRSPPATLSGVKQPGSSTASTVKSATDRATTTTIAGAADFIGADVTAIEPGKGWTFGVVQVEIGVTDGRLVGLDIVKLPPRDDTGGPGTRPTTVEISNFVAPILRLEALRSDGVDVASVSGATYTVSAFRQSLQDAMREAGL